MMGTFAEELYSESLKLADVKIDSSSSVVFNGVDRNVTSGNESAHDDDDFWDASDEVAETSDLDREWEKRRNGFQTIGYRDGIIAGKEASAQEGFNLGFNESVNAGYRWGLVRGVTSALALLPGVMKDKLMETDCKRIHLQKLFESTSSVSTTEALKSFLEDIIPKKRIADDNITSSSATSESFTDTYYRELTLLVKECPALNIQPTIDPQK